jgi:hypothetical protein
MAGTYRPITLTEEQVAEWDYGLTTEQTEMLSTQELQTYFDWKLADYQGHKYRDHQLWNCFAEDFCNFTEPLFKSLGNVRTREMREYLRANGVYVGYRNGKSIGTMLHETMKQEQEWPEEELRRQIESGINSYLDPSHPSNSTSHVLRTPKAPSSQPRVSIQRQPAFSPELIREQSAAPQRESYGQEQYPQTQTSLYRMTPSIEEE